MDLVGTRHNCPGPGVAVSDVAQSAAYAEKATKGVVTRKTVAKSRKASSAPAPEPELKGDQASFDEATSKLTGGRAGRAPTVSSGKAILSLSLDPALKRRLKMYAIHHNETVSAAVTRMLERALYDEKWK